jgi:uncharacterized glyoxalase superfamily protein PhnB
MKNPTVFPTLVYDDANAAIDFLTSAFAAERHAVYSAEGTIQHAELRFGNGIVMFSSSRSDAQATRGGGGGIYVVVDDPDAHFARAHAAGAEIVREPFDTDYGSRDYGAKDPEGNVWHFGTYQPFAVDHAAETATTAA